MLLLIQYMDSRMQKLKERNVLEDVEQTIDQKMEAKVNEMFIESQEREKRKQNIIIVNLPESTDECPEERKSKDLTRARELIEGIMDQEVAKEVEDPARLGHIKMGRGAKPRLLKLVVRSEKAKAAIMKSDAKLNREVTDPAKRVFINHDTALKERGAFKKLRAELRARTEAGEQILAIRGGKIVTLSRQQAHGENAWSQQGQKWLNMGKRSVNSFNQVHELNQEYGVLYSNMVSFFNKKDEFMAVVCNLKPKIIALTEIIAKKQKECNKSEYSIPGYDLFINKNPKLGTAIFTDSRLNAIECIQIAYSQKSASPPKVCILTKQEH